MTMRRILPLVLAAILSSGAARADTGFAAVARAGDAELEDARGGFSFGNGLFLDFAIDSMTEVNGVARDRWSLRLSGANGSAGIMRQVLGVGDGVRVGADSMRDFSGLMTLLGNTRDNVAIRHFMDVRIDLAMSATLNSRMHARALELFSPLGLR